MKLLIVEDEQKTLRYLTKALEENGFVIDGVDDGIDGLHMALEQDYEAIILDVMLPGIDGYQVLERLRKKKQTPVLMLSARGNVEERVKGLQKAPMIIYRSHSAWLNSSPEFRHWSGAVTMTPETSVN